MLMQVKRELSIHRELCHDNIVKVYAILSDDSAAYMLQEHVGGISVSKQQADAGGYLQEQAVAKDVILPLLAAVQYLHGKVPQQLRMAHLHKHQAYTLLDTHIMYLPCTRTMSDWKA